MGERVLVVVHQAHSTPGRVGAALEDRGYVLDRRCPNLGDTLPEALDAYAAMIVFGGPQSANDDHLEGIRAELDWLEARALDSGRPLLGICLGAQQIARVLGARVGPHPDGHAEIGYCEVRPAPGGDGFLDEPMRFYQWHEETFEIPHGAEHLAAGDVFPAQAYRYGANVYGIEFHPEMTAAMIARWSGSDAGLQNIARYAGPTRTQQLDDHARYGAASGRWLEGFLDRFLNAAQSA